MCTSNANIIIVIPEDYETWGMCVLPSDVKISVIFNVSNIFNAFLPLKKSK